MSAWRRDSGGQSVYDLPTNKLSVSSNFQSVAAIFQKKIRAASIKCDSADRRKDLKVK